MDWFLYNRDFRHERINVSGDEPKAYINYFGDVILLLTVKMCTRGEGVKYLAYLSIRTLLRTYVKFQE